MKPRISIFIFFFISNFIASAAADIINLRNGRSIEGLIEKENEEGVVLDVGFGTVKFNNGAIVSIDRSSPEEAALIRQEWKRQRQLEKERWLRREKEMEETRREKELEPQEVGFSKYAEHAVVEALLNKKVKASLLVDTGASVVLLSGRVAKRLGLKNDITIDDMVKLQLADGRRIDARYITLDSVSIEGIEAKDVGAVILEDDSEADIYDGLLGMSFLSNFNFKIDTVNHKLILERRKD